MEALVLENRTSDGLTAKIDFVDFIKNIEQDCEKTLLNRKNQIVFKQQLKENWLIKTKIIPPSFPKFDQADYNHCKCLLRASDNQQSNDTYKKEEDNNEPALRKVCKTSHGNLRNVASCQRAKSNWKLEFRKDELNILKYKYTRNREEENIEPESTAKSFKVRRVFKKLEDLKQDSCSNSKGFGEFMEQRSNNRQRLKTAQLQPFHKQRYFA